MKTLSIVAFLVLAACLIAASPVRAQTTIAVTSLSDDPNGPSVGVVTLRDAISQANTDKDGDTITFDSSLGGGTITLASGLPPITASVTIQGPVDSALTIDGNSQQYRPFTIDTIGSVKMSNLTIQNGSDQAEADGGGENSLGGGGIYVQSGSLILTGSTVSGNSAAGVEGWGGGILNNSSVTLIGCMLLQNSANGEYSGGGALYNNGGVSTLTNCTMSGNSATTGGSIVNYGGTAIFTGCTLSGNNADGVSGTGGAIFNDNSGNASLTNCTLQGNVATSGGGGLENNGDSTLALMNCTLSGNTSVDGAGGFYNNWGAGTLTNCILYGDSGELLLGCTVANCDIQGGVVPNGPTDYGGNIDADPLLGPLANNGGPTQTMELGVDSPCYGTGTATGAPATDQRGLTRPDPPSIGAYDVASAPTTATLTPQTPSNGTLSPSTPQAVSVGGSQLFTAAPASDYTLGGWTVDSTAVTGTDTLSDGTIVTVSGATLTFRNVQTGHTVGAAFTLASNLLVVTNTGDSAASGSGSLRAAVTQANADSADDTITFANGLSGTIVLNYALPTITASMSILGPGASMLAIDGAKNNRPFEINQVGVSVTISGLTIQHGSDKMDGRGAGGIRVSLGDLTLNDCTVSSNTAQYAGGILCGGTSNGGIFTLTNCAISDNSASNSGGGIDNDGDLTLTGCTLSGNSAGGAGGGIISDGKLAATNCTLAANSASNIDDEGGGGAIYNWGFGSGLTATLTNCTLSENSSSGGTGYGGGIENNGDTALILTNCVLYGDSGKNGGAEGEFGSEAYNSGTVAVNATNCDIQGGFYGTDNIEVDPQLGPLANNGGPTETMALGAGSPCYGAGTEVGAPATDQRGVTRPNPPGIGAYDMGSPSVPHAFQPGIQLISVPTDYTGNALATVLGYASPVLAVWQPAADTYSVTPTQPADSLVAGQGYWIRFPASETITTAGIAPATPFTISLVAGWNMIGCPQATAVAVSSLTVIDSSNAAHTFAEAATSGLVQDPLYTFQAGDTAYEVVTGATGSLTPYEGYWLYAGQACTLSFPGGV